mmetsp:Transcript_89472/g.213769  ORF Transcript_89472/g.213769 Transcript_89472/m.213769 type:complete len:312 (+) Transcript_89472:87-1022(+)
MCEAGNLLEQVVVLITGRAVQQPNQAQRVRQQDLDGKEQGQLAALQLQTQRLVQTLRSCELLFGNLIRVLREVLADRLSKVPEPVLLLGGEALHVRCFSGTRRHWPLEGYRPLARESLHWRHALPETLGVEPGPGWWWAWPRTKRRMRMHAGWRHAFAEWGHGGHALAGHGRHSFALAIGCKVWGKWHSGGHHARWRHHSRWQHARRHHPGRWHGHPLLIPFGIRTSLPVITGPSLPLFLLLLLLLLYLFLPVTFLFPLLAIFRPLTRLRPGSAFQVSELGADVLIRFPRRLAVTLPFHQIQILAVGMPEI